MNVQEWHRIGISGNKWQYSVTGEGGWVPIVALSVIHEQKANWQEHKTCSKHQNYIMHLAWQRVAREISQKDIMVK